MSLMRNVRNLYKLGVAVFFKRVNLVGKTQVQKSLPTGR